MIELNKIYIGDCLATMKTWRGNSVDAVVTDPPYELGFMGKKWDSSGVAFSPATWSEVLRVMKPGAYLLAFSGTRTYHRMVCAIEDAGFEIRDQIQWIYGSGFPKSLDVSKAIDKANGDKRPVVKEIKGAKPGNHGGSGSYGHGTDRSVSSAASAASAAWEGWGTALKPANEPICLARKPLEGTVAANVLKWGTGALNIDASRIASDEDYAAKCASVVGLDSKRTERVFGDFGSLREDSAHEAGRWPANVILDQYAAGLLDAQEPGASRFFYVAKPDVAERESGMNTVKMRGNNHPTVKPVDLMACLIRLVTPPGGVVLDPFLGSGTTAIAASRLLYQWIGCEMDAEYAGIAEKRIAAETAQGKFL